MGQKVVKKGISKSVCSCDTNVTTAQGKSEKAVENGPLLPRKWAPKT